MFYVSVLKQNTTQKKLVNKKTFPKPDKFKTRNSKKMILKQLLIVQCIAIRQKTNYQVFAS